MKRSIAALSLSALLGLSSSVYAAGVSPASTDARAIMQAVHDRDGGDRAVARAEMKLSDGQGRSRVRTFQSRALKFKGGTRTLTFFEAPADVRNTALLSVDYDDGSKKDDQWLYLPSLHRATRIATSGKSGSFMGSDLSYADLTKPDPADYEFKVLEQSVKVDGEDAWLIEATPKSERVRTETGYLKTHLWVSKEKLLLLQSKAWLREGQKLKYTKMTDVRKVDGVWTVFTVTARTVRGAKLESETVLRNLSLKYNDLTVKEAEFNERRLEQGL